MRCRPELLGYTPESHRRLFSFLIPDEATNWDDNILYRYKILHRPGKEDDRPTAPVEPVQSPPPLPVPEPPPSSSPQGPRLVAILHVELRIGGQATDLLGAQANAVRGLFREVCGSAARRFAAHLYEFEAGWIAITFGLEATHEYDAKWAAEAALSIRKELEARLSYAKGVDLNAVSIHTGIHRGWLRLEGDDGMLREEEVARQLASIAAPGEILVSLETVKVIEHFFQLEKTQVQMPGVPSPAFRVLDFAGYNTIFQAKVHRGTLPQLVGRTLEVEMLWQTWRRTEQGPSRAVLLWGRAGVGKSRVAYEFYRNLRLFQRYYMPCQEIDHVSGAVLAPVTRLLREKLNLGGTESPSEVRRKLAAVCGEYGLHPDEAVPLLEWLLDPEADVQGSPVSTTGQARMAKTIEVLVELLIERSRRQPLVLIVEDLQWADEKTVEYLCLILDRRSEGHILVIITSRQPPVAPLTGSLVEARKIEEMEPQELLTLARAIVAQNHKAARFRLVPRTLSRIVATSHGLPLLLELRVCNFLLHGSINVSTEVDGLYLALLSSLSREARETAEWASVIGQTFEAKLLARVSDVGDATAAKALKELERAEMVFRRVSKPQLIYEFRDDSMQSALYRSLGPKSRRARELRVARAIEDSSTDPVQGGLERLAHHLDRAGEIREAVSVWTKAAIQALGRSATAESIRHSGRALLLLSRTPHSPEKARHTFDLRLTLGSALMARLGYASRHLERNYLIAERISHESGDAEAPFKVRRVLWVIYLMRGDRDRALQYEALCDEALRDVHDAGFRAEQALIRGFNAFHWRRLDSAAAALRQGWAAAAANPFRTEFFHRYTQDPWLLCGCRLAHSLWLLGEVDAANDIEKQTLERAVGSDYPYSLAITLVFTAWLYLFRRDADSVRRFAGEASDVARSKGFAHWEIQANVLLGWARANLGEVAEGVSVIEQSVDRWRNIGARLLFPFYLGLLADAVRHDPNGGPDRALRHIEKALSAAERTGERFWVAELYLLRAELLLRRPSSRVDFNSAVKAAHEVAELQGARSLLRRVEDWRERFPDAQ